MLPAAFDVVEDADERTDGLDSEQEYLCDFCREYSGGWMTTRCPGCSKLICESCELHKCDLGYHACPCGTQLGSCAPASQESLS